MLDIQLKNSPLIPQECMDFIGSDTAGGSVVFIGTVRNNTNGKSVVRLEFEAYEPMAVSEMRKIAQQVQLMWNCEKVSIHHRTGMLDIGDIAVVIAVATPHRQAAFEACEYCIDTLKETVPIWKKEIFKDGEVWVAAHP
jgi:molybdopterin synthase catalytic subunit